MGAVGRQAVWDFDMLGGGFGGDTALSLPKYMRLESRSPSSTDLENSSAIVEIKEEEEEDLDWRRETWEWWRFPLKPTCTLSHAGDFRFIFVAKRGKNRYALNGPRATSSFSCALLNATELIILRMSTVM